MKTPRLKLVVIAVAAAFSGHAAALDFLQTYRLARQNDATFSASRASLEAGLEKLPQGRALLLPVINGTANTTANDGRNETFAVGSNFNSNGWNVTLTQPIFRWQNLVQYKQSEFQVLQSEAQFGQATQDLIVRVAQAYFDVLAAQDNIEFIVANKIAIGEQLAQAKRNFEVGTATITDTNEAQARFDLAGAQEISGQNALEVAVRALQQIIVDIPDKLVPLKAVGMTTPAPNVMDEWAKAARGNNFVVRGNEAVMEIAAREIERQRAGHYPTLDAVATTQENTNQSLAIGVGTRSTVSQNSVGLQLTLPIFAGGSVLSRTREAVALREKARQDLEASRRAAEFNARQSFLNVTNGLAQVKALEQALVSSETALQSNRVGYEVGVRINIDVLNAQQQVFQTKRDLARARYDTILNGLRLKSAAGSLTENDVELVNTLLGFEPGQTPGPLPTAPQKPPTGMLEAPATAAAVSGTLGTPAAAPAPAAQATAEKATAEKAAAGGKPTAKTTATASAPRSKREAAPAGKGASGARTVTERTEPVATVPVAPPAVTPVATTSAPLVRPLEAPVTPSLPAPAAEAPPAPAAEVPPAPVAEAPPAPVASAAAEPPVTAALPVPAAAAEAQQAPVANAAAEPPTAAAPQAPAAPAASVVPVEKSIEPQAAAGASAPVESTTVPVAMQPRAALAKELPATESIAPTVAPKTATKKDNGKTAAKSLAPRSKTARAADEATAALVSAATATAPAPVVQAAEEPPVRVYSVVEPKIPGRAGAAADAPPAAAPEPRQD